MSKAMKASKGGRVLHIAGFPAEVYTLAKITAAQRNMTLAALVKAAIVLFCKVKSD